MSTDESQLGGAVPEGNGEAPEGPSPGDTEPAGRGDL